jgi:hypothetical protein
MLIYLSIWGKYMNFKAKQSVVKFVKEETEGTYVKPMSTKEESMTITLPDGTFINPEFNFNHFEIPEFQGSKETENDRLKNLLTACYNCDSIRGVKKLIEAEIAGEG